jgi:hypothetical protein
MSFGWSVGDLIKAIELCVKVASALKDLTGSVKKYQLLVLQLNGIEETLRFLRSLSISSQDHQHAETIRRMASVADIPLQDFIKKLQKYDSGLTPDRRGKNWALRTWKKIDFATYVKSCSLFRTCADQGLQ